MPPGSPCSVPVVSCMGGSKPAAAFNPWPQPHLKQCLCASVCVYSITAQVSSPAIWLLVSQQGFLVMDSVHTMLLLSLLAMQPHLLQLCTQVRKFFSSTENSVSRNCCAVGAKPAVSVVWVMHTLKELNRPEIRHKTKQIFNNHFASTTELLHSYWMQYESQSACYIHAYQADGFS